MISYSLNIPNIHTSTTGPTALHDQSLCVIPASCATGATAAAATTSKDDVVILLLGRGHCGRLALEWSGRGKVSGDRRKARGRSNCGYRVVNGRQSSVDGRAETSVDILSRKPSQGGAKADPGGVGGERAGEHGEDGGVWVCTGNAANKK